MTNTAKVKAKIDFIQNRPQLLWIPIDRLKIDNRYQRDIGSLSSQKNIKHIVENFTWARFGAVQVAQTLSGELFILDGQHRTHAAGKKGFDSVPCIVNETDDLQEQAMHFYNINVRRVGLTALAKYHVLIQTGDFKAVSLNEILNEIDITIPKAPILRGYTKPRETQAIGALLKMIDTHSKKQIQWVLNTIADAYPEELGHMRATLIKALGLFVKEEPKIDQDIITEILLDLDPIFLSQEIRDVAQAQSCSLATALKQFIASEYQKEINKPKLVTGR